MNQPLISMRPPPSTTVRFGMCPQRSKNHPAMPPSTIRSRVRDKHRTRDSDRTRPRSEGMPDSQRRVAVEADVEIPVPADGEVWVVGAVVLNQDGRAFAQKRSPDRRLFPDCWDIVGGHVEPGESLPAALAREVEEETGWHLRRVRRLLGITTWTGGDGTGKRHEADYLVEVDGDLDRPPWSGPSTPPATGSAPAAFPASRRTEPPASTSSTT
jgi:8-oxo-dGTP diphosphatase